MPSAKKCREELISTPTRLILPHTKDGSNGLRNISFRLSMDRANAEHEAAVNELIQALESRAGAKEVWLLCDEGHVQGTSPDTGNDSIGFKTYAQFRRFLSALEGMQECEVLALPILVVGDASVSTAFWEYATMDRDTDIVANMPGLRELAFSATSGNPGQTVRALERIATCCPELRHTRANISSDDWILHGNYVPPKTTFLWNDDMRRYARFIMEGWPEGHAEAHGRLGGPCFSKLRGWCVCTPDYGVVDGIHGAGAVIAGGDFNAGAMFERYRFIGAGGVFA